MEQYKVRFAEPSDSQNLVDWLNSTPNNLFDSDILKYPTFRVVCAYNGHGPVAFLPMQKAMVMESLAVQPELPPVDAAKAFRDLVKSVELEASRDGIKEIYFACADENVVKMAQHHGFEVLPWTVLRMKL